MKLYFILLNVCKIPFQHVVLATFQVLSSQMHLVATALYTADLGEAEDLRMGVLHRKCK